MREGARGARRMPQLCSECARRARGVRRARGGCKMYGRHARAGASGWPDGRSLCAGRGCAGMRAREGWGAQGARGMWRCRVRGWACGGRERLRARARGARGSRLKFCLVRQTSAGALARGRRVRGCARAGHVGAQDVRGRARGRERLAGRSFSRREARWSAQFVRCSARSIKRFANCGNNANAPVKRTNREGLLHTFLLSEGALVTIVPVTTA